MESAWSTTMPTTRPRSARPLRAARRAFDDRLAVVFQPHRYTRTRDLFDELSRAFHEADRVWITEIYAAGEPKLPEVSAQDLVLAMRERGHREVEYAGERAELLQTLPTALEPPGRVDLHRCGPMSGRWRGEFLDAE